jgi:hypothetical protein
VSTVGHAMLLCRILCRKRGPAGQQTRAYSEGAAGLTQEHNGDGNLSCCTCMTALPFGARFLPRRFLALPSESKPVRQLLVERQVCRHRGGASDQKERGARCRC